MEQTLPLSESSTTPTKKLNVMRWVTFVLVLLYLIGNQFIFAIINSIEVVETQILAQTIANFAAIFVDIAFLLFLVYLSSHRAVRNAMIIMVAADCLWLVHLFLWRFCIFNIIGCLLEIYACSIVIMNTNLPSIKKDGLQFYV